MPGWPFVADPSLLSTFPPMAFGAIACEFAPGAFRHMASVWCVSRALLQKKAARPRGVEQRNTSRSWFIGPARRFGQIEPLTRTA